MRTLLTTLAFVALCVALFTRAATREDSPEQREATYALDGETAADARDRIERCTSSEFGFCHAFPRRP